MQRCPPLMDRHERLEPIRVVEVSVEICRNEGAGEREITEETRRPAASSGTIPTIPGVTLPGIEPCSPWWEASRTACDLLLARVECLQMCPCSCEVFKARELVFCTLGHTHTRCGSACSEAKREETMALAAYVSALLYLQDVADSCVVRQTTDDKRHAPIAAACVLYCLDNGVHARVKTTSSFSSSSYSYRKVLFKQKRVAVVKWLDFSPLPLRRTGFDSDFRFWVRRRISACGNRAERCHRFAGFLEDLPFPRPCIPALLHTRVASPPKSLTGHSLKVYLGDDSRNIAFWGGTPAESGHCLNWISLEVSLCAAVERAICGMLIEWPAAEPAVTGVDLQRSILYLILPPLQTCLSTGRVETYMTFVTEYSRRGGLCPARASMGCPHTSVVLTKAVRDKRYAGNTAHVLHVGAMRRYKCVLMSPVSLAPSLLDLVLESAGGVVRRQFLRLSAFPSDSATDGLYVVTACDVWEMNDVSLIADMRQEFSLSEHWMKRVGRGGTCLRDHPVAALGVVDLARSTPPLANSRGRRTGALEDYEGWPPLPMRVIEVSMERRYEGVGEAGAPRGSPPANGIVWHDSHLRKSCDSAGN
ncbi:hypothetical protein PR048_024655 [Dryococelus australis]|uniref:Uncharacterized protein n=1 Tax=Dryococelus australis TaxID=614101 RepID=A0ABQ9GP89_9NEOP|nr:hypothetical protein PR048_024655 [Dryococelus australis]